MSFVTVYERTVYPVARKFAFDAKRFQAILDFIRSRKFDSRIFRGEVCGVCRAAGD